MESQTNQIVKWDDPCIQPYTNQLQWIISRFAQQSMHCKTTCAALTVGTIVLSTRNGGNYFCLCLLIIAIFCFLDCYYLSLERLYRNKFNKFIECLSSGTASKNMLFDMRPNYKHYEFSKIVESFKSISIYPFYILLLVVTFIIF